MFANVLLVWAGAVFGAIAFQLTLSLRLEMTFASFKLRYCLYQLLCGVYPFEKKTRTL